MKVTVDKRVNTLLAVHMPSCRMCFLRSALRIGVAFWNFLQLGCKYYE